MTSGTATSIVVQRRGYTVVQPTRRGLGESTGTFVEECAYIAGKCSLAEYRARAEPGLTEAIRDYSESTTRRFFEQFRKGGGTGEYVFFADHSLAIGHRVASEPKLWDTKVDAFLRALN